MKKIAVILLLVAMVGFGSPFSINAEKGNCSNRFLTLVNPVRGRNLWYDKSLQPLKDQYRLISQENFSATWLLQYDVFSDPELLGEIKGFDKSQETGVFLEVSKKLGDEARVIYPYDAAWFSPRAIFLSGYSQSERRRLVDELFGRFKAEFGFYPKSVGTWWIDSYSLNYMKERYEIKSALIVADQLTTDNYGVWGQWWGVPYYPSKANILVPASSLNNKLEVAIIQWAQRDPMLAKGEGADFSNYSLQANDYIRQGKTTAYFNDLADIYLDCQNPLGQVTVGLETGIESVGYINEYGNQLKSLKAWKGLQAVTMSQFSERFKEVYPEFPKMNKIASWEMTTGVRSNDNLGERIIYRQGISFPDYFLRDKSDFLDRKLKIIEGGREKEGLWGVLGVLGMLGVLVGMMALRRKKVEAWTVGVLFSLAAYGLIFRSHQEFGWVIYYGAKVPYLFVTQIILLVISLAAVWVICKLDQKKRLNFWFLPLAFGIDPLIGSLRFTFVSGKYYLGFAADAFRFIGLSFTKPFQINFVNMDFPAYQAAALLRFDFNKIWDNLWLALVVYPLVHAILALGFGFILWRLQPKWRKLILGILAVLLVWHLIEIWQADPRLLG